jgi:hypothetical protein
MAEANERAINALAAEKAAEIEKSHKNQVIIHLFNDRHDYDDEYNVYISADESVSEQLRPIAQSVEYWVQELVCGRTSNYNTYKNLSNISIVVPLYLSLCLFLRQF